MNISADAEVNFAFKPDGTDAECYVHKIQVTLFTPGHEGLTMEAFIARLKVAPVKTAEDVRKLPPVAQEGFLKSAFCAVLSAQGIACPCAGPSPTGAGRIVGLVGRYRAGAS